MKIAIALLIAFCITTPALAEDSGLIFGAPPLVSSKLLQEIDVAFTKREPRGAILEILNQNTAGFCSLGNTAPPNTPIVSMPHGERLAAGEPARIVSETGEIIMKGCSARQATTIRVRWDTSNGPAWKEYKADAFTATPKMKQYQDLRAKGK